MFIVKLYGYGYRFIGLYVYALGVGLVSSAVTGLVIGLIFHGWVRC